MTLVTLLAVVLLSDPIYQPTGIYAQAANQTTYEVTGVFLLKKEPKEPQIKLTVPSYPTRGGWWTHPGSGRAALINHLSSGEHRGKFDRRWLETLSLSQLESLHTDDHEHRVVWDAVDRHVGQTVKSPAARNKKLVWQWYCNGRSCGWHQVWVEG